MFNAQPARLMNPGLFPSPVQFHASDPGAQSAMMVLEMVLLLIQVMMMTDAEVVLLSFASLLYIGQSLTLG